MTFSNSIGKKSNGLALLPTGISSGNTGELRFRELAANGTNYVSIKAPDLLGSNFIYTLPDAYPVSNGQVLASTTGGSMSWVSQGSGSSIGDNYIINPEMIIAQRGTSFTAVADGAYTLDRYQYGKTGTMVHTISQDSDVPTLIQSNYLFNNSYLATLTTAQTVIGVNDLSNILIQKIEGYNYKLFAQRAFTFSFWVKSSITGTFSVSFTNAGIDRSYVGSYTINATNTWERKTINVLAPPSAGTWNYTTGIGLRISMNIACGTNFQTTAGVWQTGAFYGVTGGTNGVLTNGTTFRFTGFRLELGATANDFIGRNYGVDLMLSQRYFETGLFAHNMVGMPGGNRIAGNIIWRVIKRATPTVSAPALNFTDGTTDYLQSSASVTAVSSSDSGVYGEFANLSGITQFRPYSFRTVTTTISANAEL